MNLAELSIEGTLENEIVVELHRDGYRTSGATPMSSYAGKLVDASPDTIASLIPENVRTDMNQFVPPLLLLGSPYFSLTTNLTLKRFI